MKKLAILVLATAGALTGCNTVKGVGQDVEAAGRAVGDAAQEVQEEIDDDE